LVKIRNANRRDCASLARVQVDSYRSAYAGLFPPGYLAHFSYEEQQKDWLESFSRHPDDILLAAETPQGQMIGYLLARVDANNFPGFDAEIIALHVNKATQRGGAGKALLHRAVSILIKRGCMSVMLWTLRENPVRRWYEALGGELLGEKEFEVDDWTIREVAYGWKPINLLADALGRPKLVR